MKAYSPLRYPGGKSSLAGYLSEVRRLNDLGNIPTAEPFAGGAGASLSLLVNEQTPEIFINDVDKCIHDFWWSLKNEPEKLLKLIEETQVNIENWLEQREIYRKNGNISRLNRGFATFFLNRCNRSGVIKGGGPIGGVKQNGKWKLDARYNKDNLIERCEKIARYSDRIHIFNEDGINFLTTFRNKIFYFIDPPYFSKGKTLYLNRLDNEYHEILGKTLRTNLDSPWLLTYDDCPEIRKIYEGWSDIRPFSLRYVASRRRLGRELLITPKWLKVPNVNGLIPAN